MTYSEFMRIVTKSEFLLEKFHFLDDIRNGQIFIHPTDTIYGIGCNALDGNAVKKVRELKGRPSTPFSIIPPSIEWILENCEVNEKQREYLELMPGPYTLILRLKNKPVAKEVNNDLDTLGIRIPNHWIKDVVNEVGVPIITTSANKTGNEYMTSIDDLDVEIKTKVNFIINEGLKEGKPSKLVDLTAQVKVIRR